MRMPLIARLLSQARESLKAATTVDEIRVALEQARGLGGLEEERRVAEHKLVATLILYTYLQV